MFKKILPLSHIGDIEKRIKNTVLNLENKFFSIFKIQVENIINEEDRKEKIEDRLDVIFPRYNSDDFVLRYEILKKDRKKENIVVYLLDLALLNDYIIDDMKDYGFVSIIPSFFVCREKKNINHYFNFDISETMLVVTEYIALSENGEKIFLIEEYNKRISFGGYRLLEDEKGKNYYNHLKDKIKGMYKPKVNVHFVKNIKITDKIYSIFATIEYEIGSSREPDTLHNGILTRMWIKENV